MARPSSSSAPVWERLFTAWPFVLAAVLVAATFWLASKFVEPAPPKHLVMATASKGSPYWRMAERWQQFMGKNGVMLELQETTGSLENLGLLRSVGSGVQAAILQGGITGGSDIAGLMSIGRIAYEPVWIFHRGTTDISRLADLKGKRILVGPAGGGTNFLATRLLAASGVTEETATLLTMELPDYVDTLASGKADAGFLVLAPDARTLQRLFAIPDLRLVSLSQADALSQRFPYLSRIDLKRGVVDLARNVPDTDTAMVATLAALAVRGDLHPALANLLTQAVVAAHAEPVVGPNGEAPIFQRLTEFPTTSDPEFPMSPDATRVYKTGAPMLQRVLPFWLATLLDRMTVMLLPLLGVLLPALKLGPMAYQWQVRRRLLHWYRELKRLERGLGPATPANVIAAKQFRLEEIEDAVSEIPIPVMFSNQHYDLRQHIDVTRRRLATFAEHVHQP